MSESIYPNLLNEGWTMTFKTGMFCSPLSILLRLYSPTVTMRFFTKFLADQANDQRKKWFCDTSFTQNTDSIVHDIALMLVWSYECVHLHLARTGNTDTRAQKKKSGFVIMYILAASTLLV